MFCIMIHFFKLTELRGNSKSKILDGSSFLQIKVREFASPGTDKTREMGQEQGGIA